MSTETIWIIIGSLAAIASVLAIIAVPLFSLLGDLRAQGGMLQEAAQNQKHSIQAIHRRIDELKTEWRAAQSEDREVAETRHNNTMAEVIDMKDALLSKGILVPALNGGKSAAR